jgi:hypothetical protein
VSGWLIGYAIGGAVVVIVVVVLITMIALAKSAADTAERILGSLQDAERNTAALWKVRATNDTAARITEAATAARHTLEGVDGDG